MQKYDIKILSEKDGVPERLFKNQIIDLFKQTDKRLRAYLATVQYGSEQEVHVALMIQSAIGQDAELEDGCKNIFFNMFSTKEHIDIIFISDELEHAARKICRPFYTSPGFNVDTQD